MALFLALRRQPEGQEGEAGSSLPLGMARQGAALRR